MMHNTNHVVPGKSKVLLLLPLILTLPLPIISLNNHSTQSAAGSPLGFIRSSQETLSPAQLGSAYPYDEQVGVTFTQNFSALAFNVTAVPFADPSGVGPGYLVNGLTGSGYWYQIGLAYNWPYQYGGVNPGFSMLYEVFDSKGNSIDPSNGGGLLNFTGTVNAGDIVLLSLGFSSGNVTMRAVDWQTGAVSSHSYFAYGSVFVGLNSSLDSSLGFFTGLMTEQDHVAPYYGAGVPVSYNETGVTLSSLWMWIDEWNTDTHQSVFRDSTISPVSLNSSLSQYFSSNGTAEVASSHGLVTGLTSGVTPVALPTLDVAPSTTGIPGHQVSVPIVIADEQGATVNLSNLTITTSFGRYNFSPGISFSFSAGAIQQSVTINVPAGLNPGNYNMMVDVWSWRYLDTQAQKWIPLHRIILNETLALTSSPTNPSPSGHGPTTSTNKTTFSLTSLLRAIWLIIIPVAGVYAALGILAAILLVGQERRRATYSPIPVLRFCMNCGRELNPETVVCPQCGMSVSGVITDPTPLAPKEDQVQSASNSAG